MTSIVQRDGGKVITGPSQITLGRAADGAVGCAALWRRCQRCARLSMRDDSKFPPLRAGTGR